MRIFSGNSSAIVWIFKVFSTFWQVHCLPLPAAVQPAAATLFQPALEK